MCDDSGTKWCLLKHCLLTIGANQKYISCITVADTAANIYYVWAETISEKRPFLCTQCGLFRGFTVFIFLGQCCGDKLPNMPWTHASTPPIFICSGTLIRENMSVHKSSIITVTRIWFRDWSFAILNLVLEKYTLVTEWWLLILSCKVVAPSLLSVLLWHAQYNICQMLLWWIKICLLPPVLVIL